MCAGTLVPYKRTVRERVARPGPGRRMRRVRVGTLVPYTRTIRERVARPRPGRRMRRVIADALYPIRARSWNEWLSGQAGDGRVECVRVHHPVHDG